MNTYSKDWYRQLKKSKLNPPSYIFGIVWPILYVMLAIAFLLVFINKKCKHFCEPLILFTIQMILNISWTTVFFKLGYLRLALLMIFSIIGISCLTAFKMYTISPLASYLLVPYILWLCFASYLNMYIVLNN